MAGKSAMPLLLGIGAAALLLGGKKKTTAAGGTALSPINYINVTSEAGGDERISLNEECTEIANKLDMAAHDNWLTNRYFQLVSEGQTDMNALATQLLMDQSSHCPWDDSAKWTPVMKSLHSQLHTAVKGWHEKTGGQSLPTG